MAIRTRNLLIAGGGVVLIGLLPTVGCTSILGDFELQQLAAQADGGAGSDGSTATGTVDAGGGVTGDASPSPVDSGGPSQQGDGGQGDGGISRLCAKAEDCPALATTPAKCATATCNAGKCEYAAIDKDGDGHRTASCKATDGTPTPGDDCNDDDPTIYPGAACRQTPTGTPIVFPNGTPIGACKVGAWDCSTGSAVCQGAIAPAATENCVAKNDANCNGVPDDGCNSVCATGAVEACGNVGGKPLPCHAGTRTCVAGQWAACVGNVEPKARDCSSAVDNDCSNGPDANEGACHCPGSLAIGQSEVCPVAGQVGACAVGTHKCQASADKTTAVFNTCTGPGPQARDCGGVNDNDCNGTLDELDVGCGTPCLDGVGNAAPAAQRFGPKMWGCKGTVGYAGRAALCGGGGGTTCSVATWTPYIRGGGKAPLHNYWVAENLGYSGSGSAACSAFVGGTDCSPNPMRVCIGGTGTDPENNKCNWTSCTSGAVIGVNDALGGCFNNTTAGTLCCTP